MPEKSHDEVLKLLRRIASGETDMFMIMDCNDDGDRIYLHSFEDDMAALEYLEMMTTSYRNDMIEMALKRGLH